jgi:hypothetical protein
MEHDVSGRYPATGKKEERAEVTEKRQRFVEDYCKKLGWDPKQLSFEQTLEIRQQDGWKNPR